MIEIEKGKSIPGKVRVYPYPFGQMEVGDSFSLPWDEKNVNSVRSAVTDFCLRHKDFSFTTRHVKNETEDVIRIWRVGLSENGKGEKDGTQ
jgi:hypothetical protein